MKPSLRVLRQALPLLALAALLPVLAGCPGVIEIKSKTPGSGPSKPTVAPILYEDFEQGVTGTYTYGPQDAGAKATVSADSQTFHSGGKSLRVDYETGSGSYGPGFGFGSNYLPKSGYFDARGTVSVQLWLKAPRGTTFQLCVKEGTANGADGEFYLAPQETGTGAWKRYTFPYAGFTRSIYSGNQAGDDQFEVSSIVGMQIQFDQGQGDGTLYLDDVYFK